jgi:sugar phosphate isomerase/epimerase
VILGYSTNAFTKYSLLEALERIKAIGYRGVEIMCDQPHLYPPEYDVQKLDQVNATLKQLELKVTNLNSFTLFAIGDTYLPSWIESDPDRRQIRVDHTLSSLHIAKRLGCRCISIPPGGPLDGASRSKAMSFFYAGLEKVIPEAEALDIKLLVEPEPDLMIERTSEFQAFIKGIQTPYVGINFDIGHFFCAGEDPAEAFETLFEWVGHVHLEDIGNSRIHQHLVPGDGAIDLKAVFRKMKALDYQGDMTLELYTYANGPEVAGVKSLEHLRPLFDEAGLDIV